jgi:BlaI family transcriptional regulator, penicillinase repressor
MEALWTHGELSIREILKLFPARQMPAYTTVQTTVYRMETKGIVKRVGKVGNFHIFAAATSQQEAERRLIDEFLDFFGGKSHLMMARLIESGRLSLADVREAEKILERIRNARTKK